MHEDAIFLARQNGVSLNTWLVTAISDRIGFERGTEEMDDLLNK